MNNRCNPRKLLSLALSAVMLASTLASCASFEPNSRITSSAGLESYATYLESRLGDNFPERIVLETEGDSDVDMADFRKDGFIVRKNGNDAVIIGKTADGVDRGVRYYANYCTDVDVADYSYGEGYRVKKITIAGRDISEYSIYLFPDADECHTYAATELQKYIKLACGIELPIVREKTDHMIAFERVLEDDVRYATLGDQGFTTKVDESGNLNIIGGRWTGCMYGAFELLELIGWRFLGNNISAAITAEEDYYYLYESELVEISADYEDTQIPSFLYRQGRFPRLPASYGVKLKENDCARGNAKYNGYGYSRGACHGLMGPISRFEDYEFKMGEPHPCYTREDYIEITKEYFTEVVDKKLAAGQEIGKEIVEIDVAIPDTWGVCTCNECLKLYKKDGQTGTVMYFTNIMAEYFGEKYPGIYVSMLAYSDFTAPPKVTKPLPNVNVSYCFYVNDLMKPCGNHSLNDCKCSATTPSNLTSNLRFREEFLRWCEFGNRITVWYYPGHWMFEILSASSIKNILADFKFFKEQNIHGMYPCMHLGVYDDGSIAKNRAFTLDQIIPYLLDELQWNADMTEEQYWAMVEEYYYIVFGDGANYLTEYNKWLIDASGVGCWDIFGYCTPDKRLNYDMVRRDFDYCVFLIDRALELARDKAQQEAVELFSRSVLYTGLCATYKSWYENGSAEQKAKYTELYNRFFDIMIRMETYTEEDRDISKNPIFLVTDSTEWTKDIIG